MAQVHSLDVPISKEPTWLWDTMTRWRNNMKLTMSSEPSIDNEENEQQTRLSSTISSILKWQLDAEMEWMRSYLSQLRSPVVFCHNVIAVYIFIFLYKVLKFSLNRTSKRATFSFVSLPIHAMKNLSLLTSNIVLTTIVALTLLTTFVSGCMITLWKRIPNFPTTLQTCLQRNSRLARVFLSCESDAQIFFSL